MVELILAVEPLEEEALHEAPEEGDTEGGAEGGDPEAHRARAQPLDDLIGGVRAEHVEGAVSEVEHAQDAEDERQPGGDEKEEHGGGEAADGLGEDEGQIRPGGREPQPRPPSMGEVLTLSPPRGEG